MAKTGALIGKVQTVLGLIEPSKLGFTLMHEHILIDAGCYLVAVPTCPLPSSPQWSMTGHPIQD